MEEFEPKLKVKEKTFNRAFFSKYIYIFIIGLCLLLGVSYSLTFFIQNKTVATGGITTGDLTITFTDRHITALGLISSTDKNGLSLYSKELTFTNTTSVDGKVKLTLTRTSGLNLTDMRYAIIVNGAIQNIADVPANGEVLSTVVMGGSPGETVDVELRLWPKAAYAGNESTFVGELVPEIRYFGTKASSLSSPAGKYVNFNCNGNNCEVWQIVKVENGRLVLTRQNDYSGATERVNSGRYVSGLSFNDNSLITSVSNDQNHKNVYLLRTVKISGGTGTQNDPYTLTNDNSILSEPDMKAIAEITYKNGTTTVGTQNLYYDEINYISQVVNISDFSGWTDGTNDYVLGDMINFTTDTILTAKVSQTLKGKIMNLCNDSSITYVEKYNAQANGAAIDTPDGSGNEDVCYYSGTGSGHSDAEQNGNVIFGDFCWQIVRTTADGGVKLVYNGLKTSTGKCTSDVDATNYSSNPRPSSIGVVGTYGVAKTTISGSKKYGTSYEIYDDNGTNKFRLKNVETATWSDSTYKDLIGKYVCGTSSSPTGTDETCTVLYYIGDYQSNTQASTEKYTIGTNEHYSEIGTSSYNVYGGSPALVGYMYNDVYHNDAFTFNSSLDVIKQTYMPDSNTYYYGDTAIWVNDHYELTINGATPTSTTAWSDIRSTAGGMYTCNGVVDTSCSTVDYIVANSSDYYMYSVPLSNNENANKSVTWTIGTGYEENNGEYSLTGTSTHTLALKDWYTTYSNYENYYICDNMTSSTCTNEVYYIAKTSNYNITYNKSSKNYVFGNSVRIDNGEYFINTDSDPTKYQSIWEWYKNYNKINSSHYTCFNNYNSATGSCGGTIYFVYYTSNANAYYILLSNNERIDDALIKMLNKDNSNSSQINKYNSAIKGVIDSWYENNLSTLSSYLDNDAVYCNDRTIVSYGGWSINGDTVTDFKIKFKNYNESSVANTSLECSNITDRFSKNNTKAELTYPIGLLTESERVMMNNSYASTGKRWWLGSPSQFYLYDSHSQYSGVGGEKSHNNINNVYSVRPAIVLKPGVEITGGNGSYNTPYVVNTTGN